MELANIFDCKIDCIDRGTVQLPCSCGDFLLINLERLEIRSVELTREFTHRMIPAILNRPKDGFDMFPDLAGIAQCGPAQCLPVLC